MENYKKQRFWVFIVVIIVIVAVGIAIFLNNKNDDSIEKGSTEDLWDARTQHVGNNSEVGNILSLLSLPEGLEHDHFKLRTKENEKGLNWVLTEKESLKLTFEEKKQINRSVLIIFALIDNLENFSLNIQNISGIVIIQEYDREWADKVVNEDVRNYAESSEKLQELMEYSLDINTDVDAEGKQEIILADYEYDGEDIIERLAYNTEINVYSESKERGGFVIVAPKIFASHEEEDKLKVFVTTYGMRYKLSGNILSEISGSFTPVAITYIKDDKNEYVLEKYERARGGSEFESSIREFCRLPVSGEEIEGLAYEILNHYSDYDDIRELHYKNLKNHLKKNGITNASLINSVGEVVYSYN